MNYARNAFQRSWLGRIVKCCSNYANFMLMQELLPTGNLRKLNWIISFMIGLLFFIFVLAVAHDFYFAFTRSLQALLFTVILCFGNTFLLPRFIRTRNQEIDIDVKFFIISYLFAILDFLFVKTLYSELTGIKWEGENNTIYFSYGLAILATWVINTFIAVIQNLVVLQYRKSQAQIENLLLKSNISEMSNLLLRQQIHPHFLFNALSTVKSLYKKAPLQGEDYLVHLANFLRASIINRDTNTALVRQELEFCTDYLSMQKIRFGEAFNYNISISNHTADSMYLPYFSLQSLVENALKHNDLNERSPILIQVWEEDGFICVRNNINAPKYKEVTTGQGLSNLAERYRLLGEEEVKIDTADNAFCVRIKMLNK